MASNETRQIATLSLTPGMLPETLSPAQGQALTALLAGRTMTSAAQAAGVNRTTVWRWLNEDPDFIAFYNSARVEMADSAMQSLRLLSANAVVTFRRLLSRRTVPDAVKLAAAATVLKLASIPIEGPTDPKDADNQLTRRKSARNLENTICESMKSRARNVEEMEKRYNERQGARQSGTGRDDDDIDDDDIDDDIDDDDIDDDDED
jgi:hypothetical protein